MMALLMCFFVLLLSFATMDAIRFKKMAESMKDAFGVQTEIPINEIVRGVSVVALEFSPSVSEQTVMETVKQETTEEEKERLEVNDGPKDAGDERVNTVPSNQTDEDEVEETKQDASEKATEEMKRAAAEKAVEEMLKAEAEDQAEELRKALKKEIDAGIVTVEVVDSNVIIRINEKGSFSSGSADLHPEFIDVLDRIAVAISTRPGKVIVAGHTDNRPISTQRFRSNWELSTARSVSVAHVLLADPTLDPKRFLLEGHADSDPLVPNDTPENRASNRRVELIIKRVKEEILEDLDSAKPDDIVEPVGEEAILEPPAEPIIEPVLDLSTGSTMEPPIAPLQSEILNSDEGKSLNKIESEDIIAPVIEMNTAQPDDLLPTIAPKDEEQQDDANSDKENSQYDPIVIEDLI